MIGTIAEARNLAGTYQVCAEDVLLIALNASGLNNVMDIPRLRLRLRMRSRPDDEFRLILSTNRFRSPFSVRDRVLCLQGEPLADVRELQDDNAVIGYFRRNGTAVTLNSNARSHCTGCVFCPNTLEGAADPPRKKEGDLVEALRLLAYVQGRADLRHVVEVNLSTGCFEQEALAIDHLRIVRRSLNALACDAQIGFLSSVLRSAAGFEAVAREVGRFHLVLTLECFDNRDVILKQSKAELKIEHVPAVLEAARRHGHDTDFTYIVGLDELPRALAVIRELAPLLSRFPNLQVYQPHNGLMDQYCAQGATELEFYLDFRRRAEEVFGKTPLRPLSWENYRPLWYFEFAGEALRCIR